MSSRLLHAVSLGLCLAMSSLALAAPARSLMNPDQLKAGLEANRRAMSRHLALHDHIAAIRSNPDVVLLSAHHVEVTQGKGLSEENLMLLQREKTTLQLEAQFNNLRVVEPGLSTYADVALLAKLGLTSPKALDTAIAKKVLQVAGVHGEPTDEAAMTRARGILEAQRADAKAVKALIQDATLHPDVAQVMRFLPLAKLSRTTLRIAETDTHAVEVREVPQPGFQNQPQPRKYGLFSVQTGFANHPVAISLADLHDLGLGTRAELHLALDHAIVNLFAPEDLPLHDADRAP